MKDPAALPTKGEREFFRRNLPLAEAREQLWATLRVIGKDAALPGEIVPLHSALGRITAEALRAHLSTPHYHSAAMDGFAVRSADTVGASETRPLDLYIPDQAQPINTGDALASDCDAVIMIEHTQAIEGGIRIRAAAPARQHVRLVGEDMVATELLLPANHCLRPVDLGALAACGYGAVPCRRRPHAIIIPTGAEIVPAGSEPAPGEIFDSNSVMLRAELAAAGARAEVTPIVPDDPVALLAALQAAAAQKPELILLLAGSSAGSGDYSARCIRELGEVRVHGVAIRPGHPFIIGHIEDVLICGVPGYPVSAALTYELFVRPLIYHWLGVAAAEPKRIRATLTRSLASPMGEDEYVRVRLARIGDRTLAAPLSRGAGVLSSLLHADGYAQLPRFQEGAAAGSPIDVQSFRSEAELAHTALLQGSHDPLLELLAQEISAQRPPCRLVLASVGSLGGLVALRRQHAHLAGSHLLHPPSGEFNRPYVQQHLRELPLRLITFVEREQGLIVAPGNPLQITGIQDLPRLRFVNRQRGAGTRILLDEELKKADIAQNPEEAVARIPGYDHEEYTHMAVATAVASGIADCGLGVRSAAIALGLDFVPIADERYDFILPTDHVEHPAIQALLAILQDGAFRSRVDAEGGYRSEKMGEIIYEQKGNS
ncbi:MAG: molybdopterin biosynthesis protein [Anaerolineaceae bacterium]|nr:molybdopterin biosynthesis protein [Anaerolineaceae bacterium]